MSTHLSVATTPVVRRNGEAVVRLVLLVLLLAALTHAVWTGNEPTTSWNEALRNDWGRLAFALAMGLLALLLAGSDPRRATRWAWFFLVVNLPVTAVLFLLLEPSPLWQGTAPASARRPLTGGKALLLALVVAAVGRQLLPGLTGPFWTGERG